MEPAYAQVAINLGITVRSKPISLFVIKGILSKNPPARRRATSFDNKGGKCRFTTSDT